MVAMVQCRLGAMLWPFREERGSLSLALVLSAVEQ